MAALLVVTFALAPLVAAAGLRGVRDARRLAWGHRTAGAG
jgi:hypothetical protein